MERAKTKATERASVSTSENEPTEPASEKEKKENVEGSEGNVPQEKKAKKTKQEKKEKKEKKKKKEKERENNTTEKVLRQHTSSEETEELENELPQAKAKAPPPASKKILSKWSPGKAAKKSGQRASGPAVAAAPAGGAPKKRSAARGSGEGSGKKRRKRGSGSGDDDGDDEEEEEEDEEEPDDADLSNLSETAWRTKFTSLYQNHCPEKLHKIRKLLKKFEGNLEGNYRAARAKYTGKH